MSLSRRALLGFRRRPAEPAPPAVPTPFSLDGFYRGRTGTEKFPTFEVRATPSTPTSRVGAGAAVANPSTALAATIAPVPTGMVPTVLADACLATRTFCSVCVERCPRPGAIIVTGGRPRVVAEACDGCGKCVAVCPAPVLALALIARCARAETETP